MEREQVLAIIEKQLKKSVPGITGEVDPSKKLTDYGANSLDIVEIVSGTMREVKSKIPRTELSNISDINGLIDMCLQYQKV